MPSITTNDYGMNQSVPVRSVTIDTKAINTEPLADYDLSLNTALDSQKVLIDNMNMASNGFVFDNCKFQNIRSRGLLIKSSEGKILNCTFRNIGMSCAAILYEIYWGESGVSEYVTVTRNLIDHSGYFKNQDRYAPIAIEGLGSRVDEDYLLYKNIEISHNVLLNRTTEYAVYINSARDVSVTHNSFGEYTDGDTPEHFAKAVKIMGAMNIEISDNTYSTLNPAIIEVVTATHNKNVFGKDVEYEGESVIPDSE